jgi:phage protein U
MVGAKPLMQFLGPGDENISLTVVLDARHGVKPRKTIDSIIAYRDAGKADHLVINGENITANKLVITQTSDTWNEVWNKGELVRATMEITFQEYR